MTATPSWTTSHRIDHDKVPSQVGNILEMNGWGSAGWTKRCGEQGGESKDLIGRASLRKSRMINKGEMEEENGGGQKEANLYEPLRAWGLFILKIELSASCF